MAHKRKTIRDAAVALLVAANTNVGSRVYANRVTSTWESELPAILVYTTDETATQRDMSSRTSLRTLQLKIQIRVSANDTVDDDLDAIAEQVETAIRANVSISGTAQSTIYQSTEITLDSEGKTESGVAELNYEVKYTQ